MSKSRLPASAEASPAIQTGTSRADVASFDAGDMRSNPRCVETIADFQLSSQLLDYNVVRAVREPIAVVYAFGFHESLRSGHVVSDEKP